MAAALPLTEPVINIRPMTEADVAAIEAIDRQCRVRPWSRSMIRDSLKDNYQSWVLTLNQQVVGFTSALIAGDVAELLIIAIEPKLQHCGYGAKLLYTLLQKLRGQVQQVWLEVHVEHHIAQRLYQSLGFNKLARRKDYYQSSQGCRDAWLYSLVLDP